MLIFPVILMFYAKIEWGTVVSNYLGFFLMGAALISVGIFVSSLTENQFTAGIITIAVLLAMFIFSSADFVVGIGVIDYVLSLLKILNHFDAFFIGVINIVDVLYYASIAVIFALLTIYRMEKRRIK
jgi:ABC-2 type transport system permease protein